MAFSTFLASTSRSRPIMAALTIMILIALFLAGPSPAIAKDNVSKLLRTTSIPSIRSSNSSTVSANPASAVEPRTRDVLLYAYYETEDAKHNLQFFLNHGLHHKIDFVFIINGDHLTVDIPVADNIRVIRRDNTCYDLGTFGEIIKSEGGALRKKYERFILMNSSIRGPFLPGWARNLKTCWSDIFYSALSETTKLTGITANCDADYRQHLQSMILALDRVGLDLIMPSLQCAGSMGQAIMEGETTLTMNVREAGFDAEPLYSLRHNREYANTEEFWEHCDNNDIFFPYRNGGMDAHPFDTIFVKTLRKDSNGVVPGYTESGQFVLDRLTQWADDSKYSSYDYC
ncbi:protein of unknown function [Taphrina deformans PYCC 5710]|uniref:Uncharacterized protein n=1 Tax=Taphrina deformans (strain PYCC 5710 / ATCC 11124 / CBS 356.35 / IMI 108563 / JCM 9778 / NBRC 8474) TaxID=1097556 RepID=R4X926_TAPDE|nr:protein of unknown function [Taphrina deformans PYCC 5710]|eukprot:CCG82153.1 protein of unknown function [Taphrina deformans PYCC 5710]